MPRIFLRRGKARLLVLVLPLLFTIVFLTLRAQSYDRYEPDPIPVRPFSASDPEPEPVAHTFTGNDWWIEFFKRLESTHVEVKAKAPDNSKIDVAAPRPVQQQISHDDEVRFRASHTAFLKQLPDLASGLPYNFNTTGILTTAGVPDFGQALSVVLMARQAGSRLPIQIALSSSDPYIDAMCADTLPAYNATCLNLKSSWGDALHLPTQFLRFQWKFVAIVASTFQNILFLDPNCLPVRNPDPIFAQGAEPFASTGLITWPDFWTPSAHWLYYDMAGNDTGPLLKTRSTSNSGVMVYDKARHADSLLLAAYYNYNGPRHYFSMLPSREPGESDTETFLQAAVILEGLRRHGRYKPPTGWMKKGVAVKKGYWDVKIMPKPHGRGKDDDWRGMFMQQMDPVEDHRAVMAAIEKARHPPPKPNIDRATNMTTVTADQARHMNMTIAAKGGYMNITRNTRPKRSNQTVTARGHGKKPQGLWPTNYHKYGPPKQPKSDNDFFTNSTFLATVEKLKLEHDPSRFMFFHHNGAKPDFSHILDPQSGLVVTEEEDKYQRMWGDPEWIIELTGRDVEKSLWRDSMRVYCTPELGRFKGISELCAKMRDIYAQLYGYEDA